MSHFCRLLNVIYTQNVRGIFESAKDEKGKPIPGERCYNKLEHLVTKMRRDNIDVYLIQETWDESDWIKEINGYTVLHHNNENKQSRTGVVIVLSPRFSAAWKQAGALDPLKTARGSTFDGRFIGVKLRFPKKDDYGKSIKGDEWDDLFLASVYHPYDETHDDFNVELDKLLDKVPTKCNIIIGADVNAHVGRRDSEELEDILGPFGPSKRNKKGCDLINTYQTNQLRILNTFFRSDSYTTHIYQTIKRGQKVCWT